MSEELFIEIGCEEIPARFLEKALADFSKLLKSMLDDLGLPYGEIRTAGTPRRLVVSVGDVPQKQEDKNIEKTGPSKSVAFDQNGSPSNAAIGFAKGMGMSVDDLDIVSTEKGEYVCIKKFIKGDQTLKLLSDKLPDLILSIPWPKSMKWGESSARFVRPVHWIVALFGDQLIPFELFGIKTGNKTYGHRFMSPNSVEVSCFNDFVTALRGSYVLTLIKERRQTIEKELERICTELNTKVTPDKWLLNHVANIVEWPVALTGKFDKKFLDLPREVLVTTMRDHQKYFVLEDENGNLLPGFVTISNIMAPDPGVVVKGNERVLAARLEDARFYFEEDLKKPLDQIAKGLEGMLYQADLGTYAEKTDRNIRLVKKLVEDLKPEKAEVALRTCQLAKADLVSGMVGEFPELQGIMGMNYAQRQGENAEVADGIREHYLPKGQKEELPTTDAGALVSLADKLDTIAGCFGVGLLPTGSGDPFALRRAALGIIHILESKNWFIDLTEYIDFALDGVMEKIKTKNKKAKKDKLTKSIIDFFKGRLANMLKGQKIPAKTVDSVLSVRFYDLLEAKKRAQAVAEFAKSNEFESFVVAFKRAANIIATAKDDLDNVKVDTALFDDDAEIKLYKAVTGVKSKVQQQVDTGDHLGALTTISTIRPQVDKFFDDVLVMHEKENIRVNRLALLAWVDTLFANIADFKKL